MMQAILSAAAMLLAPESAQNVPVGMHGFHHRPSMPVVTVGNGDVAHNRARLPGGNCGGPGGRDCFGGPTLRTRDWGYGGGIIEDPEAARDDGFFAGPAHAEASNGGAYYDYDRGYPYDWYNDGYEPLRGGPERLAAAGPRVRCEISWVADAKGARSPVRVCRGRR